MTMATPITSAPPNAAPQPRARPLWRAGLVGLYLPASFVVVFVVLSLINNVRGYGAGNGAGDGNDLPATLSMLIGAAIFALGGWLWTRALIRPLNLSHATRVCAVGAVCVAATTTLCIITLSRLEEYFVANGNSPIAIHQLYTLLFVPATFLTTAITAGGIGRAIGHTAFAVRLALQTGSAAALAYLVLNILQDLLGRRVGGPNAADTATMITVTLVCYIAAALTTSAVMGRLLCARVQT